MIKGMAVNIFTPLWQSSTENWHCCEEMLTFLLFTGYFLTN